MTTDQAARMDEAAGLAAADRKDDPENGIERFIGYFEKHAPEIAKLQMEMQIPVARIEKAGDREKRVKEIQEDFETVDSGLG